jgi:hypothetical protein
VVATSDAVSLEVAGAFEFGDDHAGGPFGDRECGGEVA